MSDAPPSGPDPSKPDRFEQERLKKLENIEALGLDPWGHRFDEHIPIAAGRAKAPTEAAVTGELVRVAGRIMLRNNKGKLKFYHLQDATGRIQLMVSKADVSEEQWKLIENLDLGDLIGVDGTLRLTNTGEVTVFVKELTMLCKSLAQPPEKFHGARDTEMLLRQRYIDLIYSEGVVARMLKRTKILESIRDTLRAHNFLEVETPVLQSIAGGAAARPFVTHHNALDIPLFLRISLELYLKRLMVGGIERVFEIGRVFRNEGIDATHNPEFTMLELYQAYGNYETMMDITEAIVVNAVSAISDTQTIQWRGLDVNFSSPWPRKKYAELFEQYAGCAMRDAAAVATVAQKHGIETKGVHPDVVIQEVFEMLVEPHLEGPVFVLDYPASLCPLTKRKANDPNIAERFELYVRGMELANAYTELNDPRLQEQLFSTQLAGLPPEDSMARMDHDFIRALKVGMPPAGGMGLGIDRLVMLLTDSYSIRDVIFFPLLRPET
ncbi:MAG TPA: lysine--tRNA ligase [Planctomycetaceae bacterium]|jgi:lysyl-tRNA synthetase class 2|nr:lysine--tRNA ligase [Planctomycetaceae bacterium]